MTTEYAATGMAMFVGFRKTIHKAKLYELWYPVTGSEGLWQCDSSKSMTFEHLGRKSKKSLAIGGIFDIHEENGSVRWLTFNPKAYWTNKDDKTQWYVQSEAVRKDFEAQKRLEKQGDTNQLKEVLEPLREVYSSMTGPQKAQLIADMVRYVST